MNIALIGASGYVGSAILQEALARGHRVTALARHSSKIPAHAQAIRIDLDVFDTAALVQALRNHDVVISAFSGHAHTDVLHDYLRGFRSIIQASKEAGVPRLLVVGGAGSLEVAPGVQLIDTPDFPAEYRATAEGARQALALLREEKALNWTLLSPAAMLEPGVRTGRYRAGKDRLLTDASGSSRISTADLAVAMLDEIEKPSHPRERFTVAY